MITGRGYQTNDNMNFITITTPLQSIDLSNVNRNEQNSNNTTRLFIIFEHPE